MWGKEGVSFTPEPRRLSLFRLSLFFCWALFFFFSKRKRKGVAWCESEMDVRFYPPPAQPAAAPAAPCLGPSPCLDPYYCNKVNALLLSAPVLAALSREGGGGGLAALGPAGRTGPARGGPSRARSVAARGGRRCVRSGSKYCGAAQGVCQTTRLCGKWHDLLGFFPSCCSPLRIPA